MAITSVTSKTGPVSTTAATTGVAPAASYTTYKDCHKGNIHVFDYVRDEATVAVFGGGTSNGSRQKPGQLLVALQSTDNGDIVPLRATGFKLPDALTKQQQSRILHMDIADMDAPCVPFETWPLLLDMFVDMAKDMPEKRLEVLVRCYGGHGRTGVVLCALAWVSGVCNGEDPIKWVRDRYCTKAVESNEQFDYIEELTGIISKEPWDKSSYYTYPASTKTKGSTSGPFGQATVAPYGTTTQTTKTTLSTTKDIDDLDAAELQAWADEAHGVTDKDDDTTDADLDDAKTLIALYNPVFPSRVVWDLEAGKWAYYYASSTTPGNHTRVLSEQDPVVAGRIFGDTLEIGDNGEELLIEEVAYLPSGTSSVTFEGNKKFDFEEIPPTEAELEYALYLDGSDCWLYRMRDWQLALCKEVPTVHGLELTAGLYKGQRVNGVMYGLNIIRLLLASGEQIGLERGPDGDPIEAELTVHDVSLTSDMLS